MDDERQTLWWLAAWLLSVACLLGFMRGGPVLAWPWLRACLVALLALGAIGSLWVAVTLWRRRLFGCRMLLVLVGALLCALQLVVVLMAWRRGSLAQTTDFTALYQRMPWDLLRIMAVPVALAAAYGAVTNVALMRHNKAHYANALCLLSGAALLGANGVVFLVRHVLWALSADVLATTLLAFAPAVALLMLECLLVSFFVCNWAAALTVPRHRIDYLVILGCGLREDGTPARILRRRVDRALRFDEEQAQRGMGNVTFVPSGGQGFDESISEAESVRRYLRDRGVPDRRILLEDRATSTMQNMVFSRNVIARHAAGVAERVSVAFVTTNYHVFRTYLYTRRANLDAQGVASITSWYFWPNAFVREFLAVIVLRWRTMLATGVAAVVGLSAVAMLLAL